MQKKENKYGDLKADEANQRSNNLSSNKNMNKFLIKNFLFQSKKKSFTNFNEKWKQETNQASLSFQSYQIVRRDLTKLKLLRTPFINGKPNIKAMIMMSLA